MNPRQVYRSARGSTVHLHGSASSWTIDARPERLPDWRSIRFRSDPPRLVVWRSGDQPPQDIPLEEARA